MWSNTVEQTKLLLEAGADVNISRYDGRKPIHEAENINQLRLLIEYGADPEAKDKVGNTPLRLFSREDKNDPRAVFLRELGVKE